MKKGRFKYYVLLADMRTGSNLFEETITQFDNILCFGELFNPHFVGRPKKPSLAGISLEQRDSDPVDVIKTMIQNNPDHLTGFRLFSDHDPKILEHCLNEESCAKIILTRNPMDSFVSHEIAAQTGQWRLRNLHVRKSVKIKFEMDKFQKYLEARIANQTLIKRALQITGQTAFHLTYDDMAHLDTFNGVAKFLGIRQQLTATSPLTKRQNPDQLRDKLTNYDEMREQVRGLNIFERDLDPYVEPSKTRASSVIHAGRTASMMYFPLTFDVNDPTVEWMRGLETDGKAPQTNMTGVEVQNWLASKTDRVVITRLENPIERAYRAFNDRIVFLPPEKNKWIKTVMIGQFDLVLPQWEPNTVPTYDDLTAYGYDASRHADNFLKFLGFLKGNLRGQTRAPVSPEWGSQHLQVENYHRWTVPTITIRPDQSDEMFSAIENILGKTSNYDPENYVDTNLIPLSAVYSPEIERAARIAYFHDYRKFGFQNWKPKG